MDGSRLEEQGGRHYALPWALPQWDFRALHTACVLKHRGANFCNFWSSDFPRRSRGDSISENRPLLRGKSSAILIIFEICSSQTITPWVLNLDNSAVIRKSATTPPSMKTHPVDKPDRMATLKAQGIPSIRSRLSRSIPKGCSEGASHDLQSSSLSAMNPDNPFDFSRLADPNDEAAWESFHVQCYEKAFRVAMGIVHNHEDAKDVVYMAMKKLHRKSGSIDCQKNPEAYFLVILSNLAKAVAKKASKRRSTEASIDEIPQEAVSCQPMAPGGDESVLPELTKAILSCAKSARDMEIVQRVIFNEEKEVSVSEDLKHHGRNPGKKTHDVVRNTVRNVRNRFRKRFPQWQRYLKDEFGRA